MSNSLFRSALTCILGALSIYAIEPKQLTIRILEGNDVINYLNQRTAQEPVIQVEDENRKPVPGALVLFELPQVGPSGLFPNGVRTLSVLTDAKGQAIASGLRANTVSGEFHMTVTASYQDLKAKTLIRQINQKPIPVAKAAGHGRTFAILGAVGSAVAVGTVVATRRKSANQSPQAPGPGPSPTVVTPGNTSVGPPR